MRTLFATSSVALLVSLSTAGAFAQTNNPASGPAHIQLTQPDWNRDTGGNSSGGQAHRSSEARVLKKGPLAPSEEDRTTYAGFLTQPHTGLIRLLPRPGSQSKHVDGTIVIKDADGGLNINGLKIRGGGAYYSFAFLTHEYGDGSDLELSTISRFLDGSRLPAWYEFSVGFAGANYGMMTTVNDRTLEEITGVDPPALYLLAYRPPRKEPAARAEALAFREGRLVDLQFYRSRMPIQLNTTYLLRSINYGTSDVVVAFRVVRQDTDSSVTIAWKLLKKFDPVQLER